MNALSADADGPSATPAPAPADAPADALAQSWRANAGRWTDAVRQGRIESRRLVTDRAVLDAVRARRPGRVLDLGCGEGWLARALVAADPDVAVLGVDASPELVARAQAASAGSVAADAGQCAFRVLSYAELIADPRALGVGFDVVVANFALLDAELAPLLRALAGCLGPGGALVVQTLHPGAVDGPYADGWRRESFAGFGDAEEERKGGQGSGGWVAMPWYFRTLGSWLTEIAAVFRLVRVAEPSHPETGRPVSLLVTAEVVAGN